jgi:hypothetical protein
VINTPYSALPPPRVPALLAVVPLAESVYVVVPGAIVIVIGLGSPSGARIGHIPSRA